MASPSSHKNLHALAESRKRSAQQRWKGAYEKLDEQMLHLDLENRMGGGNSQGVHGMWRCFSKDEMNSHVGVHSGFLQRSAGWSVGNTLVMTVAFALIALPEVQPSDSIPLSFWTHQLYSAYAFLAVVVSARGIFEISTIQEDLAVLPPALISHYNVALRALRGSGLRFPGRNLGGGRDGSGCVEWTKVSLRILISAAVFLVYTLHGPVSLPWLLVLFGFDCCMQTNVAHRRYRATLWRNVEAEIWDEPENRRQWPDEFRAWQQGKNFFFQTESGWLFNDEDNPHNGWNSDLGRPDWWKPALSLGLIKMLFCVKEITNVCNYVFNSDRLRLNYGSYAKFMRLKNLREDADADGPASDVDEHNEPGGLASRRVNFPGDVVREGATDARGNDLLDLEERAQVLAQVGATGGWLPPAVRLPAPHPDVQQSQQASLTVRPPDSSPPSSDADRSGESLTVTPPKASPSPPGPKITLSDGRVVTGFRPMNFRRAVAPSASPRAGSDTGVDAAGSKGDFASPAPSPKLAHPAARGQIERDPSWGSTLTPSSRNSAFQA